MGEIVAGLYDDLGEFDNEAERPASAEGHPGTANEQPSLERTEVSNPMPESNTERPFMTRRPQPWLQTRTPPRLLPRQQPEANMNSQSSHRVKYYIMKSNNSTNIDRSLASGVWSTQHHNEAKLNSAFLEGSEVRLIFSINQSGHFQGYATMKSAIGRGPKHNIWIGSAWGGFFEVEWQIQHDFPFSRFEHLSNPLNEGKPVKFARDGQEIPTDVGNEVARIMEDIARSCGIEKPVIANQLKVEPYPPHSLSGGRNPAPDRREFKDPGQGRGRITNYRWADSPGRYGSGFGAETYGQPPPYMYAQRWNMPHGYGHAMNAEYPRSSYGGWRPHGGEITSGTKRQRSPVSDEKIPRKKSLYQMSYEEYLQRYGAVQTRIQEAMRSGELWKALGMIPENQPWSKENQIRIEESGWFNAWFGYLADIDPTDEHSTADEFPERKIDPGFRSLSEAEFVDFCRRFCGEEMHVDEDRIKAYFSKMEMCYGTDIS